MGEHESRARHAPEEARAAARLVRRYAQDSVSLTVRGAHNVLASRRYVIPPSAEVEIVRWGAGKDRNEYAPTPWRVLDGLLPVGEVAPEDVLLDYGCGMGRVMLEAADRYPFARVLGLELSPDLLDVARALLAANGNRFSGTQWEVVTGDATEYEVPDDVTVVFLYDPFKGPVLDAALAALIASVDRRPRPIRLVYLQPKELDQVLAAERIELMRVDKCSRLRTGVGYRYAILEIGLTQRVFS
jgi:SAM-dependent methyltransferase